MQAAIARSDVDDGGIEMRADKIDLPAAVAQRQRHGAAHHPAPSMTARRS